MRHGKVLLLGIDGGTWQILEPAMNQGYMPFLKHLVDIGASGVLASTIPAITPAAWSAFQTGMNPGKTGALDFAVWDKARKRQVMMNSLSLGTTMWEMASEFGLRVGVINVPMTYPAKPLNGYMVTGLMTPSLESRSTHPPDFKNELLSAVPTYQVFASMKPPRRSWYHTHFDKFISGMVDVVTARAKAAQYLLTKESFDLFMLHFQGSDFVQHVLWGYIDETHPLFDNAKRKYIFEHFYSSLDENMHKVHSSFQEQTKGNCLTIVCSDHGFQKHEKRFNLGNWLYEQRYVSIVNAWAARGGPLGRLVKRLDFLNLRNRLLRRQLHSVGAELLRTVEHLSFSLGKSRVLSTGNSGEGYIYLLEQDEYRRKHTARQIVDGLLALKDPKTGVHVVDRICRKEEIFSGSKMHLMPDLVVLPAPGYSITGYYRPKMGLFHKVNINEDYHIGKHHIDGIFVCAGAGVKAISNLRANIVDIAPTVLWYLGLEIPREMDGRIIRDSFEKAIPKDAGLATSKREQVRRGQEFVGNAYSEEDERKIKERLRDLGYL